VKSSETKMSNLGYVPSVFSDWKDIGKKPHGYGSLGFRSQ
jgi:hypothetical protein